MSRGLADNVLSGTKAGFKAILDILKHPFEKEKMFNKLPRRKQRGIL